MSADRSPSAFRPALEALDRRDVPAGFGVSFNVIAGQGVIQIDGQPFGTDARVSELPGLPGTTADDLYKVTLDTPGGVPLGSILVAKYLPGGAPKVHRIEYKGGDGHDRFVNDTGLRSVGFGGNGNDIMVGGSAVDVFDGGMGVDRLYGRGGNDVLKGGGDADLLDGGAGNDRLYGGRGDDVLVGGVGKDYLFGETGNDSLDGGHDGVKDVLVGGLGADKYDQHHNWVFPLFVPEDQLVGVNPAEGDVVV